jgi:hypothetical protein
MDIQALIPPALAALHNFIWQYDPEKIHMYYDDDNDNDDQPLDFQMGPDPESVGELGGPPTPRETVRANERRDKIANDMREQYQRYLESCAAHDEK